MSAVGAVRMPSAAEEFEAKPGRQITEALANKLIGHCPSHHWRTPREEKGEVE
uniref:Uncharacterized protein n=2 Tax=Oryza sativa subsp. japonica TaxID=39947 RepID=Q9FRP9_ORYSJ|nr:hypothetical protein [Oryza sativa Japonica Group]AAP55174.1 hypothetical protein LOC_Os10g42810 [Oryza sativa Japonica Group]